MTDTAPHYKRGNLGTARHEMVSHSAVAVTEVVQVALNDESLGEKILLTMIASGGSRATFAIPPLIGDLLVQRLPVFLAQIAAAKLTKQ